MVIVVGHLPEGAASVGILAGAFNPPTVAHQALVSTAASVVDRVVCVLPKQYPHKPITGATLDQRIAMLAKLGNTVALADRGLLIDMAREFRRDIAPVEDLLFLCGRDAAERFVSWDYGDGVPSIAEQLREYRLLVCQRNGGYVPPTGLDFGIRLLESAESWDEVSSTQVRQWLAAGDGRWRGMVPEAIAGDVERIYGEASDVAGRAGSPAT